MFEINTRSPITRRRLKLVILVLLCIFVSLIISKIFGSASHKPSRYVTRGPAKAASGRSKRATGELADLKDPFALRPRIQTRNGHLIIEASQEKNIEFRTRGARGSVTINGFKIDQLLDVTRALEKTSQHFQVEKTGEPVSSKLEALLKAIASSSKRLDALEKSLNELSKSLRETISDLGQLKTTQMQVSKRQRTIIEQLKRDYCTDQDSGQPVCKNGATCLNTYEGYKCLCPANFEGPNCDLDVDECAKFRGTDLGCQNGARCINNLGGYRCECPARYHGVHCTEQHDDCALSSSQSLCGHGTCVNLARTVANQPKFECICDQGWTTDGSNRACTIDIDECALLAAGSNDTSVAMSALNVRYPCSLNPPVACINLPGSFQCGPCPAGYTGNGRTCFDIDECLVNNGGCSQVPQVECFNTLGGRRCGPCPLGYLGDGASCKASPICLSSPNGGCHAMAKCVELGAQNGRICVCQWPFVGIGVGSSGCQPVGSLGSSGQPTIIDASKQRQDCDPNPCTNGAKCNQLAYDSFECTCLQGYSGRYCEKQNNICQNDTSFEQSQGSLNFTLVGTADLSLLIGSKAASREAAELVKCNWSIKMPNETWTQLGLTNTGGQLYMFLANSTRPPPTCVESLTINELVSGSSSSPTEPILTTTSRLLAKFCTDSSGPKQLSRIAPKQLVSLVAESTQVQLQYSFPATRTGQSGSPRMAFGLAWAPARPACGGQLDIKDSGSVSSPRYPADFYPPGSECRYIIRVPAGKRVRLQFSELALLANSNLKPATNCSDSLLLLDGFVGAQRPVLFRHCANNASQAVGLPGPIYSSSSTVELLLTSDVNSGWPLLRQNQKKGFLVNYTSEWAPVSCGGLYVANQGVIRYPNSNSKSDLDTADYRPSPSDRKLICEYEIRPAKYARNHRVVVNQLVMPWNVTYSPPYSTDGIPTCSISSLSFQDSTIESRFGANANAKTVCPGQEVLPQIISSGHNLWVTYITTGASSGSQSGGFELHYETICTATYRGLAASFEVQLEPEVPECVYHIMAPVNTSISLLFETDNDADQSIPLLADGTCALEVYFSDGALQDARKSLSRLESKLRAFAASNSSTSDNSASPAPSASSRVGMPASAEPPAETTSWVQKQPTDQPAAPGNSGGSLSVWQHDGSSKTVDIKEFDLCRSSKLTFTTTWNHVSFLIRLRKPLVEDRDVINPKPVNVQSIRARYQAEASCGGVISEPPEGNFKLETSKRIGSLRDVAQSGQNGGRDDFNRKCAWVLKANETSVIRLVLVHSQTQEIQNKLDAWKAWIVKNRNQGIGSSNISSDSNSSDIGNSATGSGIFMPEFKQCSQVFAESIELYQPSKNKSHWICPIDFLYKPSVIRTSTTSIVYVRLHDNSTGASQQQQLSNSSGPVWPPSREPLKNWHVSLNYSFVKSRQSCDRRFNQESGIIQSPGYPDNYQRGIICVWIIQLEPGQQIRLNFTDFNFPVRNSRKLGSYLEIRQGPESESPLIGRFRGRELDQKVLISHTNYLLIEYITYGEQQSRFSMRFDAAQTGCGGHLSSASGQIDSPNYPQPFGHRATCEWSIQVGASNQIDLEFRVLELRTDQDEPPSPRPTTTATVTAATSTNCTENYLEIFDQLRPNMADNRPSKSLGRFCSLSALPEAMRELGNRLRSSGSRLLLVYKSKALSLGRGFSLTYSSVCTNIKLSGFRGAIESPGRNVAYAYEQCSWTIQVARGNKIGLVISQLDIDQDDDYQAASSSMKLDRNSTADTCWRSPLSIWSILANSTTTSSDQTVVVEARSETVKLNGTYRGRLLKPEGGRLVSLLCGSLNNLNLTRRHMILDSNVAFITLGTALNTFKERNFRLEWQAVGCGGELTFREQINQWIDFNEISLVDASISTNVSKSQTNGYPPIECLWLLQSPDLDKRLELSLDSDMRQLDPFASGCSEGSLTVYDGPDDKSPVLAQNCNTRRVLQSISTNTGQALVKFSSSGRHYNGFNFHLSAHVVRGSRCIHVETNSQLGVNKFVRIVKSPLQTATSGQLDEGAASASCSDYLLSEGGRLALRIDELNIPTRMDSPDSQPGLIDSQECSTSKNYLLFSSSRDDNDDYNFYCGRFSPEKDASRALTIFKRPYALIAFRSKLGGSSWQLSWARLCGSAETIRRVIDFKTPNYPEQPDWPQPSSSGSEGSSDGSAFSERVCLWTFSANQQDKQKGNNNDKLRFELLNFVASSRAEDCLLVFEGADIDMKQMRFNLTDINKCNDPKLKLCKKSDITYQSIYYVSLGQQLTVMTTGNTIAKFRLRPFDSHCGGEFQLSEGSFASPNFPNQYEPNLDCFYHIVGSPGAQLKYSFELFDLLGPSNRNMTSLSGATRGGNCDEQDHLEVYILPPTRSNEHKWSRYRPNSSSSSVLPLLPAAATSGEYQQVNISAQERRSDRLLELARLYAMLQRDTKRSLSLDDLHSASLIGKFCDIGRKFESFTLPGSQLVVRLRTYDTTSRASQLLNLVGTAADRKFGFLFNFKLNYGDIITVKSEDPKSATGLIGSPMYPAKLNQMTSLKWTLIGPKNWAFQFDLIGLNLGDPKAVACRNEYISIRETQADSPSATLCGLLSFKSTDQNGYLALNKHANPDIENSLIMPVFIMSNVAIVEFINKDSPGQFVLRYKAMPKQLALNMSSLLVGNRTSEKISSTSTIEPTIPGDCSRRIELRFGKLNQTIDPSFAILQSPGFPNEPNASVECHWLIYTQENRQIQLDTELVDSQSPKVNEYFFSTDANGGYMMYNNYCFNKRYSHYRRSYVVIYDGSSMFAPELGRFCLPLAPKQLASSGQHLFVRYVHHENALTLTPETLAGMNLVNSPLRLRFKSKTSINRCGGHFHAGYLSTIKDHDDSQGKNYDNNLHCKYYLFASSLNESLSVYFRQFNLASVPTNSDCTEGDYVIIKSLIINDGFSSSSSSSNSLSESYGSAGDELVARSEEGRTLGRFCAGREPGKRAIDILSSGAIVEFVTDSKNNGPGWKLTFDSHQIESICQEKLVLTEDEPFGRISSPGWPHGFFSPRDCNYLVVGPAEQIISFNLLYYVQPKDADGQSLCSRNKLTYIEASELDHSTRTTMLAGLSSTIRDGPLKGLVRELPCSNKSLASLGKTSELIELAQEWGDPSSSSGKLNVKQYLRMLMMAQGKGTGPIKSQSSAIMFNFKASSVQASEGFLVAVSLDGKRQIKCHEAIKIADQSDASGYTSAPSLASSQAVLLESDRFGQVQNESSDFIQCVWRFEDQIQHLYSYAEAFGGNPYRIQQNKPWYFEPEDLMGERAEPKAPGSLWPESFTYYIVYQVHELPKLVQSTATNEQDASYLYEDANSRSLKRKTDELCGPYRLRLKFDSEHYGDIQSCGNLTGKSKWQPIRHDNSRLLLRTKNLLRPQFVGNSPIAASSLYRGLRAYYYRTKCAPVELLSLGNGIRIKSQLTYPNSTNYSPGICWWKIDSFPGLLDISFKGGLNFRKPAQASGSCDDADSDPTIDYIDFEPRETDSDSVDEATRRICYYNQDNSSITVAGGTGVNVYFVAGLDRLVGGSNEFQGPTVDHGTKSTGFDMMLTKANRESDFCAPHQDFSIFKMIATGGDLLDWSPMPQGRVQNYPNNTFCSYKIKTRPGRRFNFTFVGIFDMESSANCENDYIQLESVMMPAKRYVQSIIPTAKTESTATSGNEKQFELIGRWCGRNRPDGFFVSKSNMVQVTFRSDNKIEGRGFRLVHSQFKIANSTNERFDLDQVETSANYD